MKVDASDDTRSPESLELALRAFAISAGCPAYANAARVAQISRSSPVNWICPGARPALFTDPPRDQAITDRR